MVNKIYRYKFVLLAVSIFCTLSVYHVFSRVKGGKNNVSSSTVDDEKTRVLARLFALSAVLIDVAVLKDVANENFISIETSAHLTFGVLNQTFNFNDLNCDVEAAKSVFKNQQPVISSFYIICERFTVQVAVFYTYGKFLWIGKDEYSSVAPRWFGDVPRAIHDFTTKTLIADSFQVKVPADISSFLFDYYNSRFIECNRELAEYNKNFAKNYTRNEQRNRMMIQNLNNVARRLEGLQKHYWLAGGTLLGWYRDCTFIPFTTDLDIAIRGSEYTDSIRDAFMGHATNPVQLIFGLKNDSYELRLQSRPNKLQIDMFIVYSHNETNQWCGYQLKRKKYKRLLPNFSSLCSGELHDHKVLVPCEPANYLNNEYGEMKKWIVPKSSNYSWTNLDRRFTEWTDNEWPYAIKFFFANGTLNAKQTIRFLNAHSKLNLTKLPDDVLNV